MFSYAFIVQSFPLFKFAISNFEIITARSALPTAVRLKAYPMDFPGGRPVGWPGWLVELPDPKRENYYQALLFAADQAGIELHRHLTLVAEQF
jgi:hypothetical protein